MYYYRARYYDPATGRFIQIDPWGFGAHDANLYRYVGNSPLAYTDPLGLKALTVKELQELLEVLQKEPRNGEEQARLDQLIKDLRKDGVDLGTGTLSENLEYLDKALDLIDKLIKSKKAGGLLSYLQFTLGGVTVAVTGIGKINEKMYERYKEARTGRATHDEAYTFNNEELGNGECPNCR